MFRHAGGLSRLPRRPATSGEHAQADRHDAGAGGVAQTTPSATAMAATRGVSRALPVVTVKAGIVQALPRQSGFQRGRVTPNAIFDHRPPRSTVILNRDDRRRRNRAFRPAWREEVFKARFLRLDDARKPGRGRHRARPCDRPRHRAFRTAATSRFGDSPMGGAFARRCGCRCVAASPSPPPAAGLSHMTELGRAFDSGMAWHKLSAGSSLRNAGTHHPWPQKNGKKASASSAENENPRRMGSLRSQGRLGQKTLGIGKFHMHRPPPLAGRGDGATFGGCFGIKGFQLFPCP